MKPGVRYGSSPKLNNANHALNCPAHQWGIGGRHKYNAGLLRFTMPVKYTDEHNEKDCTELFFNIGQNTTEKICKEYIHNNTNFEIMRKRPGQGENKYCTLRVSSSLHVISIHPHDQRRKSRWKKKRSPFVSELACCCPVSAQPSSCKNLPQIPSYQLFISLARNLHDRRGIRRCYESIRGAYRQVYGRHIRTKAINKCHPCRLCLLWRPFRCLILRLTAVL